MRHFRRMTWIVLFIFPLVVQAKDAPRKSAQSALSEKELLIELTGEDQTTMNEEELFSEIVAAFQAHDEIGLKSRSESFLSRFPKSPFADNVLYLRGRQALELKKYGLALKNFQQIITDYPRSNRAVSAYFAKAMTYKKMNLESEAKKVLQQVRSKFPGSPEYFRADNEMRFLN